MERSKEQRRKRLQFFLATITVLVVIGVSLTAYSVLTIKGRTVIPEEIQNSAGFYIPVPNQPPKGWVLDKESYRYEDGVVFYRLNNQSRSLLITVQRKPETFDFKSFYAQGLSNASEFSTDSGIGAIGKTDERTVGSLLLDESWVLTTTQNVQSSEVRNILSSLK